MFNYHEQVRKLQMTVIKMNTVHFKCECEYCGHVLYV